MKLSQIVISNTLLYNSLTGTLHRRWNFGRDPTFGRHEGLEVHRRHQQGRRGPHLPSLRLRPRRRPLQSCARDARKDVKNESCYNVLH